MGPSSAMKYKSKSNFTRQSTRTNESHANELASLHVADDDFPRGGGRDKVKGGAAEEFDVDQRVLKRRKKENRSYNRKQSTEDDAGSLFGDGISGKLPRFANKITLKNVTSGMKLWGVIAEVNEKDIVVSLPGGLRGLVRACDAVDTNMDGAVRRDDENKYISKMYHEGQLVSCIVLQVDDDSKEITKRKIRLSLRLSLLYKGLTLDAIQEGMVLAAYVRSIEDHGFVLHFGVSSFTGFITKHNLSGKRITELRMGQLLQGAVTSVDRARKVVHLTSEPEVVSKFVTEELNGISIDLLTPGMLVNARVISTLENGIILSFLSYFTGTVDIFNLDKKFPSSNWKDNYFKNMKVNARILFIDPSTRAVGLTLNPDLVRNHAPSSLVKIGDIFDQSKVVRVDKGFGVLLELPTLPCPIPAYVNVADVSDKDGRKWDKNFKEGSVVRIRILGYRLLEGLATGALKASAIEGSVFTHSDVKPGMVVKAKIIAVDSFGAIVQFASGVKALCPLRHMSELEITKPPKKFQVGVELNFRVLGCKSKRITVTHKKTLLKSKLKILSSYADAIDGLITHGWITKIEKHGCFVRFYNGVQGFAQRSELGLGPASDISSIYHVEQVVKSRVIKCAPTSRRINLSFNITPTRSPLVESMKPGTLVSGTVEHVTHEAVIVGIDPSSHIRGTVSIEHLSDHHGLAVLLMSVLKPGYHFDQLLVLDIERNNLVLSAKYSLVNSSQQIPLDIGGICCQSVMHGYICNIIESGCFVRFLGRLTGFAPKSKATDDRRSELSEAFYTGQSVRCNIVDVNTESGRITLSLKQSLCFSTDASFIQEYFLLEEKIAQLPSLDTESYGLSWIEAFGICSVIEGKVHEIKDFGVVISFEKHSDVYGFISRYQLGEAILDINSTVRAAVLDVSKIDRLVDLSLKPEFVNTGVGEQPHNKKRKGDDNADLDVNQTVNAVVEIVKENYLVLSLPDHKSTVGYASLTDYNTQKLPCKHFTPGERVSATIMCLPDSSPGWRLLLLLNCITLGLETSSSKRAKKKSSYDVGHLVQAEITEIKHLEARVKFGSGLHGRIHVTETSDDNSAERPFSTYRIGQTLTARIVSKGINRWELSVKPSVLEGSIGNDEHSFTESSENFNFIYGQCVSGYVYKIDSEWASLAVTRDITAKLHILDSSCEPPELAEFNKRFYVGKAFSGYIISADKEKKFLRLVLNAPPVCPAELKERGSHHHSLCHLVEGSILGGRISKILPGVGGLLVQIGPHNYGKVHFTELTDLYESNPLDIYQEGQFVKCKVLEMNLSSNGTVQIDLSLRATRVVSHDLEASELISRMNIHRVDGIKDLHPDMVVKGYVKGISAKGCFIMLSRKLDAKVLISNLSDDYIENPEKDFPIGKLVTGKVQLVEPLSKRIQVTLKTSSESMKPCSDINFLDHVNVGNIISGRIKRLESYGLFISIDGTNLVGLCHISELSDDHIEDLDSKYTVGEKVTAKILKVDKVRNRVSLGMKCSYMEKEDELRMPVPQGVDMNCSVASAEPTKTADYTSSYVPSLNVESGNIYPPIQADSESRNLVPPLEVTLDDIETLDTGGIADRSPVNVTAITEENRIKRAKKRVREERELETRAAEDRLLENGIPRNADEFEKLIRSSPNSSFLWIKYMEHMVALTDIEKARSVAERALKTINIREEAEKLNIWVAYFNLENEFGTPPEEAVKNVFQRALQYNDPKKVHLALLGVYERSQQHKCADGLLERMTRKFKHSCKVWLKKVQSLLRHNSDGTRSVVTRALQSLPRHKHIKFISKTAILEFKDGVPDHGRSMFEGMLREYPKRTDLWSIYLDQEIRLGDADVVRALFERAISLSLPPKKIKFLFKKYLEYEKSIGDEERMESVKRKAIEYVESALA